MIIRPANDVSDVIELSKYGFVTRQKWLNTIYSKHKKTKVAC